MVVRSLWVYFLAICGSSLSLFVLGEMRPLLLLFRMLSKHFCQMTSFLRELGILSQADLVLGFEFVWHSFVAP